ncbi:MAG: hypothetical protein U0R19_37875 [Bryobacteraceae bacterium]
MDMVIRDDDLEVIDAICKALEAAVAAGLVSSKVLIAALSAVIIGLVKIGRQVQAKAAFVSRDQLVILMLLKENPLGLTLRELTALSNDRKVLAMKSEEDILATLKDLSAIALRDGSVVAIVAQDAGGMWRTQGI